MLQLYHSEGSPKTDPSKYGYNWLAGYTQNSLPSSKHWHCKIVGVGENINPLSTILIYGLKCVFCREVLSIKDFL